MKRLSPLLRFSLFFLQTCYISRTWSSYISLLLMKWSCLRVVMCKIWWRDTFSREKHWLISVQSRYLKVLGHWFAHTATDDFTPTTVYNSSVFYIQIIFEKSNKWNLLNIKIESEKSEKRKRNWGMNEKSNEQENEREIIYRL